MIEPLTRVQVEHIAAQLSESTRVLSFPGSQLIAGWLLTDADLRAQLAAMTERAEVAEQFKADLLAKMTARGLGGCETDGDKELVSDMLYLALQNRDRQLTAMTERDRVRHEDYQRACGMIAAMHRAAMGVTCGPSRGVVEDVEDLRTAFTAGQQEIARLQSLVGDLVGDIVRAMCPGTLSGTKEGE